MLQVMMLRKTKCALSRSVFVAVLLIAINDTLAHECEHLREFEDPTAVLLSAEDQQPLPLVRVVENDVPRFKNRLKTKVFSEKDCSVKNGRYNCCAIFRVTGLDVRETVCLDFGSQNRSMITSKLDGQVEQFQATLSTNSKSAASMSEPFGEYDMKSGDFLQNLTVPLCIPFVPMFTVCLNVGNTTYNFANKTLRTCFTLDFGIANLPGTTLFQLDLQCVRYRNFGFHKEPLIPNDSKRSRNSTSETNGMFDSMVDAIELNPILNDTLSILPPRLEPSDSFARTIPPVILSMLLDLLPSRRPPLLSQNRTITTNITTNVTARLPPVSINNFSNHLLQRLNNTFRRLNHHTETVRSSVSLDKTTTSPNLSTSVSQISDDKHSINPQEDEQRVNTESNPIDTTTDIQTLTTEPETMKPLNDQLPENLPPDTPLSLSGRMFSPYTTISMNTDSPTYSSVNMFTVTQPQNPEYLTRGLLPSVHFPLSEHRLSPEGFISDLSSPSVQSSSKQPALISMFPFSNEQRLTPNVLVDSKYLEPSVTKSLGILSPEDSVYNFSGERKHRFNPPTSWSSSTTSRPGTVETPPRRDSVKKNPIPISTSFHEHRQYTTPIVLSTDKLTHVSMSNNPIKQSSSHMLSNKHERHSNIHTSLSTIPATHLSNKPTSKAHQTNNSAVTSPSSDQEHLDGSASPNSFLSLSSEGALHVLAHENLNPSRPNSKFPATVNSKITPTAEQLFSFNLETTPSQTPTNRRRLGTADTNTASATFAATIPLLSITNHYSNLARRKDNRISPPTPESDYLPILRTSADLTNRNNDRSEVSDIRGIRQKYDGEDMLFLPLRKKDFHVDRLVPSHRLYIPVRPQSFSEFSPYDFADQRAAEINSGEATTDRSLSAMSRADSSRSVTPKRLVERRLLKRDIPKLRPMREYLGDSNLKLRKKLLRTRESIDLYNFDRSWQHQFYI